MNSKQLWSKLIDENMGYLECDGTKLIPKKEYKINNTVIDHLEKDIDGKITIILKKIEIIDHPGDNIDYSLYGTPKHSMGD